jgi:ABC-type nitrate/sulfonate/bicarbonate transport system substrate-binding protein
VYLARELNTFRACGLEPQIEEFPGSGKAMEALLGGSIDVVSGYHEQTMQLPSGAPPLQSFLAMTNGHMVALIAPKVDRIDQLPGKKVGGNDLGLGDSPLVELPSENATNRYERDHANCNFHGGSSGHGHGKRRGGRRSC